MPTDRTGKEDASSSSKHTKKTSIKDAPHSNPGTAPLLPGASLKTQKASKSRKAAHITKKHTVKHVKILHKRAAKVAIQVSHSYKKTDTKIVAATKRVLPERTLHQLAANRAAHNGNLRFAVPMPTKPDKKMPVVIPKGLRHIRHAALPGALVAVLVFALGFVGASPPGYGGTKVLGGSGADKAAQVTTDASDNVYTIGTFDGTVNFAADWSGTDNKTSTETSGDIFITKANANGSYGWTKRIPGSVAGSQYAYKIVTDNTGVVYVAGAFDGTVNFAADWSETDEKTSAGLSDGFLTKINSDGSYGWTKRFGGTDADSITGLAVDASNNVSVGGTFAGDVTFDADFGTTDLPKTSAGLEDAFIVTVNSDGRFGTMHQFGSAGTEQSSALAISSTGDRYLVGACSDTVNFAGDWEGGADEKTCNADDIFVTKINSDDSYGWTKVIGDSGVESVRSAVVDSTDNLYIGGSFASSSLNFANDWSGSDTKTKAGARDGFVTKIASNGTYGWTHVVAGSGVTTKMNDIAADTDNNIYLAGTFDGTVNFAADWSGSDTKTTSAANSFITRVNSDNTYGWTVVPALGTDGTTEISGITTDSQNALYSSGNFTGTINFANDFAGTDEKTSNGSSDIFLTKITTVEILHKVTDASGLTYKDSSGTNLSSTGTSDANPTVYIHDQDDDTLLATIIADLTEDRDWSGVSGDSDLGAHKMYINDAIGAPGADTSMTLYVPRNSGDKAVVLCPGATSLASVTKQCANKQGLTDHDSGVSVTTIAGQSYWVIANRTDQKLGAMSMAFPGVSITETGGSTDVTEGGAGDYITVQLNAQPTADVTVTFQSSPSDQLKPIDPIVFTPSDWSTPVNVYVEAVDDALIEGNHTASIGYTTASTDTYFDNTTESDVITVHIADNDHAGVTLHATSNVTSENGDTAEICVTLTAQPPSNVTLHLSSSDTSEVTVPSTITITPANWNNQAANCFNATGVDDDEVDGPKDADIKVTSITSSDSDFANLDVNVITPVTITNQDNDSTGFIVSTTGPSTTEAGGTVQFCIKLTARPSSGSVTIPVSVSDPSEATLNGVTSIVIPAASWNTNHCVTVTGVDDDVVDGDITYTIVTGKPSATDPVWDALTADDIADATLTNLDDDVAGVIVTETSGSTNVTEGGATDTISVVLTSQPASGKQVVVHIQPDIQLDLGGGAGQAVTKTFTESNWNQPQPITVTAVDDTKVEGDHTGQITVTVDASTTETPYLGLAPQSITAHITDNDIATASIATVNDATENPSSNGRFRVTLDHQNDTGSDMVFAYTVSGSAASGTHYNALSGSVTILSGGTSADIVVDVSGHDNNLLEGNKTVIVTLTSATSSSAQVSATNHTATVVIFDDERATVSLAKTQDGHETGPVPIIYTATLSKTNNTGAPITVTINATGGTATSGSDYQAFNGQHISIPDGATTGTITVSVIDDNEFEALTETVDATISSPSVSVVTIDDANKTAQTTITDNDTAEIGITASQPDAAENPSVNGEVTIALDKVNHTGTPIKITYTVSGTATPDSDYDALSGHVTIADGQQSAKVIINTAGHNDDDMEGPETVIITYESNDMPDRVSAGGSSAATVTIADDEVAGVIVTVPDNTTSEDGDTGKVCFALKSRPSSDVTIALESSDPDKVSTPSSVTITRNNWNNTAANCVTVTGHDDSPPVATGTQDVTIRTTGITTDDPFYTALTGADIDDAVIHHADNDTAGVIVTPVSTVTSEDGTKTAVIRFSLRTRPTADVIIPVSISDPSEGHITVSQIVITPDNWNVPTANELVVTGVDDHLTDGTITYQLITGKPTSDDPDYNALSAGDVADVTLTNEDDDVAGVTVTQTGGNTNVTEGGVTDTIGVVLTSQPAPGKQVVVQLKPDGELDLGSSGGQAVTRTFTNTNWDTPQQVTVATVDDTKVEGDHTGKITVTVDDATTEASYSGLDPQTITVHITDNDIATASITKVDDAVENPAQNGKFRVTLDSTNHTGAGMTFHYTVSGTAASGTHYAPLSGTVTVADGADNADIIVDVTGKDNDLLEGDKTVVVTLTSSDSPSGAVSATNKQATVTIADDERATVSLSKTQHGHETGPVPIIYTATLSKTNNTGAPITVIINPTGGNATKGDDYEDFSGRTITIPDGSATGTIQIPVIDDDIFEALTETVQATISQPSSSLVTIDDNNKTAQATITDNETATISVVATKPDAAENPSVNGEVTFELDKVNNTGNNIDITYTVSGTATPDSDYDAVSGQVSIPNGQQSAKVVIDTTGHDDDDMEGPETVILTYASNNVASRVSVGPNNAATVTIADDEAAGVNVYVVDDTTSEDGGTGKICFSLKSRPSAPVTITLASEDATKVSVPGSVTIARNNWNNSNANCVTTTGHDDNPPEVTGTQDITIYTTGVVSDDPFYTALTGVDIADAVMHHADNDAPGITVQAVSNRTKEDGSKTAVVQFRLQTQPSADVVIPLSISNPAEGHIAVSQIVISPENWNKPENNQVMITGVDDPLIDGDISYQLITGKPTSDDSAYNALNASDVADVTLINEDDDVASVVVTETVGSTNVTEGGATDAITVSIGTQPAPGKQVVIKVKPADIQLDIGAGAGAPIELTFTDANWQTPQTVTVAAFDDTLLEGDHTSQITYEINTSTTTETPYNSYPGTLPTTSVHITDNDTATATITMSDGSEAGPVPLIATVTLDKQNDMAAPITFTLNPDGGTATRDVDYADFTNTTVSIPVGSSSAEVQIAVIDDALLEGDETVNAILTNSSMPAVSIPSPNVSAKIIDNDTADATIVATKPSAAENPSVNGEFTVYISKVNNTGAPITVQYDVSGTATAGSDYTALSGSVAIPNGASSAVIPVITAGYDDALVEGNETVIVTLTSTSHPLVSVGNPHSTTVTIADDDGFTTNITTLTNGHETGPVNIVYRVELSQVNHTGQPFTVEIADTHTGTATAGNDYQAFGGTVTIPDGQKYADYAVTVLDDNELEDLEETVGAEIRNPSEGDIGIGTATATITDNETATATIAATKPNAAENPSVNGEFTITLDKPNHGTSPILITYTVNGTATAGQDYAPLSGTAMIAVGQSDTVITVDTAGYDDNIHEGDETVIVSLASISHPNVSIGNPHSATVTIADDDPEDTPTNPPGNSGGGTVPSEKPSGGIQPVRRPSTIVKVPVQSIEQTPQDTPQGQAPKPQPVDQKPKDLDGDGIPDEEEDKASNNGDGNGDGVPDSQQSNVSSVISKITNKPVTLEAKGSCSTIEHFAVVSEDKLTKQDKRHTYPFGLIDYRLGCDTPKQSAIVTVYYDQDYANPGNWRKFMSGSEAFVSMDFVKNAKQSVGRNMVTTASYIIHDGSKEDDDGKANGKIVDPAGFAVKKFYILDAGWAIPVIIAGWFVGYAIWHRAKDHRRYR